jgi:hypothetical protein
MVINTKPYVSLPDNLKIGTYTLGVTTKLNAIDQRRNTLDILPGYYTTLTVIPQSLGVTDQLEELDILSRGCKLVHEADTLNLTTQYTKTVCEFECATQAAISKCQCLPWYITNNFTRTPICDPYGGYCFEEIMSNEANYKKCPDQCWEDCSGEPLTLIKSYLPINTDEVCRRGRFFDKHFTLASSQHFAFENYKALISGEGIIPDLGASLENGSMCKSFVAEYIAIVSVESPTNTVTKSAREPRVTFIDQLGTIGGTLGLFTGISILSMIEIGFFVFTFLISFFQISKDDALPAAKKTKSRVCKQDNLTNTQNRGDHFECYQKIKVLEEKIENQGETIENQEKRLQKLEKFLLSAQPENKKCFVKDQAKDNFPLKYPELPQLEIRLPLEDESKNMVICPFLILQKWF